MTLPGYKIPERLKLRDAMLAVFQTAAKERPKRPGVVPIPGDPRWTELAWVSFERDTMLAAVNKERSVRGLLPVTLQHFMRVEQLAVGHSDYCTKFALYCAELAMGEENIKP